MNESKSISKPIVTSAKLSRDMEKLELYVKTLNTNKFKDNFVKRVVKSTTIMTCSTVKICWL